MEKQINKLIQALKGYGFKYVNDDKYKDVAEYLYNENCRIVTDGDVFFTKEQWAKLAEKN